ncbi:MAG: hypothetical protein AB1424_01020 [Thermodesulfobacteriota bacterium]
MKLLVATSATQGQRKNDFNFCTEGEFLSFTFECDGETIDGPCGCRRSLSGLDSRKATTTMRVANVPAGEFINKLVNHLIESWNYPLEEAEEQALQEIRMIQQVTAQFPEGAILEKRGNEFFERRTA